MVLKQRDPSVERTEEYDNFIKELEAYHGKRGTVFESMPKVGPRHVDLFKLYKRVVEEGGYDHVSDIKGNKLAWRKIAMEFMPGNVNVVQMAFLVKTAYYKNLAAYEISTVHKREPPPKEILEDVSAKGGDLLNRTVENYAPRVSRERENLANGGNADSSEDEQKTPNAGDKMETDEPGSQGRTTRGLRQAPPQRVLFGTQTDSAGRSTRSVPHGTNSPTPGTSGMNGTYASSQAAITISNYEPQSVMPATVKPVATPSSQPTHFRELARRMLAQRRGAKPPVNVRGTPMLPGSKFNNTQTQATQYQHLLAGFTGANIYMRALFALQSGQPAEVRYALHHMVKISHERWDKYMFEQFPGLAEALLEQVLKVSSLFYDVQWRLSYEDVQSPENDVLNALTGTPDLLQKLHTHRPVPFVDGLQTDEFATTISNVNEAGLVLRNMVLLEQNADYLVRSPLLRDVLVVVLNLPKRPIVTELQHYALDIAEQITKYFALSSSDPLYNSLLAQTETSDDRGAIITSLRALSRISMILETSNRLANVSAKTLQRLCDWLLVEDEELRSACLDFLYQYTAITDNVEAMTNSLDVEALVAQLVRMLMHGAQLEKEKERPRTVTSNVGGSTATNPPKLSAKIVENLIATIPDERELSSAWLRTCFEEDPGGEITQLALWSAYNEAFAQAKLTRPLMQAKDFITNVSNTFTTAQAQVVYTDPDPSKPKYTIRGVRPRAVPVDMRGRPYLKCLWKYRGDNKGKTECEFSVMKAEEMWDHVMLNHFHLTKDPESGKYKTTPANSNGDVRMSNGVEDEKKSWSCNWGPCTKMQGEEDLGKVVRHTMTHLPDTSLQAPIHKVHNVTSERIEAPTGRVPWAWLITAVDERGDATGLPLASILVLRNLARQLGKIDAARERDRDEGRRKSGGEEGCVRKCFGPVREWIAWVGAWNRSLKEYMPPLEYLIDRGMGVTTAITAQEGEYHG